MRESFCFLIYFEEEKCHHQCVNSKEVPLSPLLFLPFLSNSPPSKCFCIIHLLMQPRAIQGVACYECRLAHTACLGGQPCSRCSTLGLVCQLATELIPPRKRGRPPKSRPTDSSSAMGASTSERQQPPQKNTKITTEGL